jgi:hypothetical protein
MKKEKILQSMIKEIDNFFDKNMKAHFGDNLKEIKKRPKDMYPTMYFIYHLIEEQNRLLPQEVNKTGREC